MKLAKSRGITFIDGWKSGGSIGGVHLSIKSYTMMTSARLLTEPT